MENLGRGGVRKVRKSKVQEETHFWLPYIPELM